MEYENTSKETLKVVVGNDNLGIRQWKSVKPGEVVELSYPLPQAYAERGLEAVVTKSDTVEPEEAEEGNVGEKVVKTKKRRGRPKRNK